MATWFCIFRCSRIQSAAAISRLTFSCSTTAGGHRRRRRVEPIETCGPVMDRFAQVPPYNPSGVYFAETRNASFINKQIRYTYPNSSFYRYFGPLRTLYQPDGAGHALGNIGTTRMALPGGLWRALASLVMRSLRTRSILRKGVLPCSLRQNVYSGQSDCAEAIRTLGLNHRKKSSSLRSWDG